MFHKLSYRNLLQNTCVFALIAFVYPCSGQTLTASERAEWSQKLVNLIPNSLEGTRTVQDLAALQPDSVYQILADNWKALSNSDIKQYVLGCVVQNDNARVLDILQLGVSDSSLAVQARALQFSEMFGFDSFTEDFAAYQVWRQRSANKPLKQVIEESMKAVVDMLPTVDEAHRGALLNILVRTNLTATSQTSRMRREAALKAGLAEALVPWIKQQNNLMWTSYQIIRNLRPAEDFTRHVILPLTAPTVDTAVRYQALSVIGVEQNTWAAEPLLKMLVAEYPDPATEVIGQSLAQVGDPHVIPALISLMSSDNTPEGNRAIGNILTPLTGVTNAYVRDAAWWKTWWAHNNARFAADVRSMTFPRLTVRARPAQAPNPQNALMEAPRPTLKQIGGDAKRAYWFIDPHANVTRLSQLTGRRLAAPLLVTTQVRAAGGLNEQPPAPPNLGAAAKAPVSSPNADLPGLIVVLTSDGDAASAAGFWHDVAMRALDKRFCIAVVAAPKWTQNQQSVWLTAPDLKGFKSAAFSTETLIDDVVKDVVSSVKIDPERIFLHGSGNGGVPAYASALADKSPFHGFYIVGSTFKTSALPSLEHAAGRRFLIHNTKDDRVHPFWMAEAAQKLLTQKGAIVKLEDSAGYAGLEQADAVMARIKASFDWLAAAK